VGNLHRFATGDGEPGGAGGSAMRNRRASDGLVMPMKPALPLGNVDMRRMPTRDEIQRSVCPRQSCRDNHRSARNSLWFDTTYPDQVHFNTTAACFKFLGTDRDDLTAAEIEGRRQVQEEMVAWADRHDPRLRACLTCTPSPDASGRARETPAHVARRGTVVTEEGIARADQDIPTPRLQALIPVDIHNPSRRRHRDEAPSLGARITPIPYRAMLP